MSRRARQTASDVPGRPRRTPPAVRALRTLPGGQGAARTGAGEVGSSSPGLPSTDDGRQTRPVNDQARRYASLTGLPHRQERASCGETLRSGRPRRTDRAGRSHRARARSYA
jgi:hypothetical protein